MTTNESNYEFKKYSDTKPSMYRLKDVSNPMHLKMFITNEDYEKKIPKSQQKYYEVI